MVDEWSDKEGQPDGQCKMVCRQLDHDGWSDRKIVGLMGGVTDCHVNDELTGWWMDWAYDGQTGLMDGWG